MKTIKAPSTNGLNGFCMWKNAKRSIFITLNKLKSKWIKDSNINPDTLKLVEEKMENSLKCIGTVEYLLNRTSIAQALRLTINKWDLRKLKSFCKEKDTIKRTKWQPTEWEKIFTNPTSHSIDI